MRTDCALDELQAKLINPITLAFVGDAVYTLFVRERLAVSTELKSGALNAETSHVVCASAQAELIERLLPHLSETEADVYRRARNAKKPTKSKHSTVSEYNKATGFEALIGFLYLTGNAERLEYVLHYGEKNED